MTESKASTCPKCGQNMSDGFILDRIEWGYRQATWIEGVSEPSFWQGIKTSGRKQFKVTVRRCNGCGFLESFADEPA